jgi:hypothetical protein
MSSWAQRGAEQLLTPTPSPHPQAPTQPEARVDRQQPDSFASFQPARAVSARTWGGAILIGRMIIGLPKMPK